MFEKELERVRKQLKQQLSTGQPHVALDSVLANESVHPAYRQYFRAEVEWWIHEERVIRMSNPRFDTTHPDFHTAWRELDAMYLHHARFDVEELNATIDAAVKTRLNYLLRPRVTLKWFIFRGEPTRTLREILLRLQYFTDYRYLLEGIEHWARTRSSEGAASYEILSVVEFERIIEKIDNDHILDLSQREFVGMLDPMYEFFASANPDLPPECVPTEAVIIFLDDKTALPISQALERLLYRQELRTLTRLKLVEVIDEVIAGIEAEGGDQRMESPEPPPALSVVPVPELTPEPIPEPTPELTPEPTPELIPEPTAELTPEPIPEPTAELTAELTPEPTPELARERTPATIVASRRQRLEQVMDARSRDKVLKKLFRDDQVRFDAVVEAVLTQASWKDAASALDRLYAQIGIEPNSAPAMELSQALFASYQT